MPFKVAIFGPVGSGKTTFLHRLLTGEFLKSHVPTLEPVTRKWTFHTTAGPIEFELIDTPLNFEPTVDAGIYFAPDSEAGFEYGRSRFRAAAPDAPMVTVWAKSDLPDRRQPRYDALPISAREYRNLETAMLTVTRMLLSDDRIEATESPAAPVVRAVRAENM